MTSILEILVCLPPSVSLSTKIGLVSIFIIGCLPPQVSNVRQKSIGYMCPPPQGSNVRQNEFDLMSVPTHTLDRAKRGTLWRVKRAT